MKRHFRKFQEYDYYVHPSDVNRNPPPVLAEKGSPGSDAAFSRRRDVNRVDFSDDGIAPQDLRMDGRQRRASSEEGGPGTKEKTPCGLNRKGLENLVELNGIEPSAS
jgi:hypothetical protein